MPNNLAHITPERDINERRGDAGGRSVKTKLRKDMKNEWSTANMNTWDPRR